MAEEIIKKKGNPAFGKKVEETAEIGTQNTEAPTAEASVPLSVVQKMIEDALRNNAPQPQVQYQSPAYAPMKIEHDIEDIPELAGFEVRDRIYILSNGTKPISFSIAKEHRPESPLTYTNFDTQTVHPLRYATNQISFFIEKQTKELGSVMSTDIIFHNGMLKVPASNIILQKFLAIHPHKDVIFREYDPKEKYREALAKEDLDFEAKSLARKVGLVSNRAIASLVIMGYNELWDVDTVNSEIYSFIRTNPEKYIALAQDPNIKAKGIGRAAVLRGYLTYRNYKFINEKSEVVLEVQRNQDEYDALADFLLSGHGRSYYDFLTNSIV